MKCTNEGCAGEYQRKLIDLVERHNGERYVICNVPALVCDVCGDTMFEPEIVRNLEKMFEKNPTPTKYTPMLNYRAETA